ncbi:MAG TPA: IPT/TIG domain-containing protein [Anaerolineales bacterium]|nr:IPT/TIG domain-containing protein [Anaerolineales bacterium]
MNVLSKINHVPLKYVAGMNIAILVMAVTFISINTIDQTTEYRSQATESPLPSPILTITLDSKNPPQLLTSDPDWAKIGDALLVRGQNLGNIPFGQLFLGNTAIPHQNIVEWTSDYIVITIPPQANSNPLTLKFNQDQILQTSNTIRIVELNQTEF